MTGMLRAKAAVIAVLLLSYGAVGARQPAVRTSVPLPVPATEIATAFGLDWADRSQLLLFIVRSAFDAPEGQNPEDANRRARLEQLLRSGATLTADTVPLPLDPSIWRETLLGRPVPDADLVQAILADRRTALLYHGLASLDDETLGWVGPDRETLLHLRRHAAAFAVFGRSVRVKAGRVAVPGGPAAEPVWSALVGAEPSRPAVFVQRLFGDGSGRLPWFYDTVAHLDPSGQRLALAAAAPGDTQIERARDLLHVFEAAAPEWRIPERPFTRPNVDPSLLLMLLRATADGEIAGPSSRQLWERVFKRDEDGSFEEVFANDLTDDASRVGAAWLARRVSLVPQALARRRLETVLFAQRVFPDPAGGEADLATALRGYSAFPALMVTLERLGVTDAAALARAARHAAALCSIGPLEARAAAIAQFQSGLAIVDRAAQTGGLDRGTARRLAASLIALDVVADRGYDGAFAAWIQASLMPAVPAPDPEAAHPVEDAVLAAMAGVRDDRPARPAVEWDGRRYRVDPALAELRRLRRVRERQYAASAATASLDARLAAPAGADAARALASTLVSLVYAGHPGDADGPAAGVSARHDFGLTELPGTPQAATAWRLPREEFGGPGGWRVVGSILALETAVGRLRLRRPDANDRPAAPLPSTNERHTAMALLRPRAVSDAGRDEIAEAIARGRARVASLSGGRAEIERVARDAGLSEWRREALGWTLAQNRSAAPSQFSLVDLFWLGAPGKTALEELDAWGAAREHRAGRPGTRQLATRGAAVALRVAEVLAELRLPAALAPAVVGYAMQDVINGARPAYLDNWPAVEPSARGIPRDRLVDYIDALAADGPLIAVPVARAQR